ncbi:MAG: hypothetical protein H0V44_14715 [Planctomycetes bacterium]|nr:hypothetical protein [Planctomycetota bacterium]
MIRRLSLIIGIVAISIAATTIVRTTVGQLGVDGAEVKDPGVVVDSIGVVAVHSTRDVMALSPTAEDLQATPLTAEVAITAAVPRAVGEASSPANDSGRSEVLLDDRIHVHALESVPPVESRRQKGESEDIRAAGVARPFVKRSVEFAPGAMTVLTGSIPVGFTFSPMENPNGSLRVAVQPKQTAVISFHGPAVAGTRIDGELVQEDKQYPVRDGMLITAEEPVAVHLAPTGTDPVAPPAPDGFG